jgi:hypothetical protein
MNTAHPTVNAIVTDIEHCHPVSDGYPANPVTIGEYDGFITLTIAGSTYHEGEGDGTQWLLVHPTPRGATVITAEDADWHEAARTSDGSRHRIGYERIAARVMR